MRVFEGSLYGLAEVERGYGFLVVFRVVVVYESFGIFFFAVFVFFIIVVFDDFGEDVVES